MNLPANEGDGSQLFRFERLRLIKPPEVSANPMGNGDAEGEPAAPADDELIELVNEMR